MKCSAMNPKRHKLSAVLIMAILTSIQCFAGEPLDKDAQENAARFFENIIKGDFDKAYDYTDGSVTYRSGAGKNYTISGKKEFLEKSSALFNKEFRDVLRNADNSTVECCLSSNYVWTEGEVYIWFNPDGSPYVIVNPYMIRPSFECSKAQTEVETAICQSLLLADQDQILAGAYVSAETMLTGHDYKNLKPDQLAFIKGRNGCRDNKACIRERTDRRIEQLNKLIKNEESKPAPDPQKGLEELAGVWKSVEYRTAANCAHGGRYAEKEAEKVEVYINYPSILKTITNTEGMTTQQHCVISKVYSDTFARVYYRGSYRNAYWGSCGGDIFRLPYAGRYLLLKLSSIGTQETDCGVVVLTGHEGESPTLIYGDYLIDDLTLDHGHVLRKVNP